MRRLKLHFAHFLNRLLGSLPLRARPATADRDSDNYFNLGSQYYLAARAATFAGCFPVAGNLFHHAVELYVKGDLITELSRTRLKMYGHNLKRLWAAYKKRHRTVELSRHDPHITKLHKFEKTRYPDSITDRGMWGTIAVAPPSTAPTMWAASGVVPPSYHLVVNDIDQLIRSIFDATSRNPDYFFGSISLEGRTILHRDNPAFPAA